MAMYYCWFWQGKQVKILCWRAAVKPLQDNALRHWHTRALREQARLGRRIIRAEPEDLLMKRNSWQLSRNEPKHETFSAHINSVYFGARRRPTAGGLLRSDYCAQSSVSIVFSEEKQFPFCLTKGGAYFHPINYFNNEKMVSFPGSRSRIALGFLPKWAWKST